MNGSVLTYIFGNNHEILRDPLVIDNSTEYICVTDNPKLRSSVWNIKYDNVVEAKSVREKMVYVKYNPFKYVSTSKVCVIDGSMQLSKKLDSFWKMLDTKDMLINKHPERDNLFDELHAWESMRNMDPILTERFNALARIESIDLHNKFLIGSCILGFSNNHRTKQLCKLVIAYMKFLGLKPSLFPSNQCVLSYLLQKNICSYRWIFEEQYSIRYKHNTWLSRGITRVW